jgi:hypothetical protein
VDYALDPGPLGLRRLRLTWSDPAGARLQVTLREGEFVVPLGLDGAYRFDVEPGSGERVGGRGRWEAPNRFIAEVDTIARINHYTIELAFDGDRLRGVIRERTGVFGEMPLSGRALRDGTTGGGPPSSGGR